MRFLTFLLLFLTLVLTTSCDLVQVLDLEPQGVITEESAIRDAQRAELVRAGMYNTLRQQPLVDFFSARPSQMGIEAIPVFGSNQYYTNNVSPEGSISAYQTAMYTTINNANYLIRGVRDLPDSAFEGRRKTELIAEGRFMRGLFHFYLLRLWGQFYDNNSSLGIVLKEAPSTASETSARSTVEESYTFILDDLDYAIEQLPVDTPGYYASRYAAMAAKAKVLLYMGNYAQAASTARQVIDEGPFALEPMYATVFEEQFNSQEVMFATYNDEDEEVLAGGLGFFYALSDYYMEQAEAAGDETRLTFNDGENNIIGKYPGGFSGANTTYYLRLAETYLIYAEAVARSGGSLTEARSALNTIRNRANLDDTNAQTRNELISAIRQEKLLELVVEQGESWYDLVRYAIVDGLDISEYKSTVTEPWQYILPMPQTAVDASDGRIVQNPEY